MSLRSYNVVCVRLLPGGVLAKARFMSARTAPDWKLLS
jgi:hypothetical protein